jgi:soluble lytic murein transglycosylase
MSGNNKALRPSAWAGVLAGAVLLMASAGAPVPAWAQAPGSAAVAGADVVLEARDALRRRDRNRLAAARAAAAAARSPLASWVDYWELGNRLGEASQADLNEFYSRWSGTYVEDRLRNDWLLELGRRRDWRGVAQEYPRFRMNDDREVTCYALLARHEAGDDVTKEARAAWMAQRDLDDGCTLMATTLYAAQRLGPGDVWRKARAATENNRPRAARHAAGLVDEEAAKAVDELFESPPRYLVRRAHARNRTAAELAALALIRLGASDPDGAAVQLDSHWAETLLSRLGPAAVAWVWHSVAKQAAMKLLPSADGYYQRAATTRRGAEEDFEGPEDMLAWKARSGLRANNGAGRWQQVMQAINAMGPQEQREPAWVYWKARALLALARDSQDGEALRQQARELLSPLARQVNFYGKLAAEELGQPFVLPPRPAPLTEEERSQAHATPGLARALALISLGLRNEGVREWNFTLRGMNDRELLAAAQLACEREVWDRCINTSERTQQEVDVEQRFPTPFRRDVLSAARDAGLDAAFVYGLIRQESRFAIDARSAVGASGLMQLMPATAQWTARKVGMAYSPGLINDPGTNLRLGTSYLRLVLDDFGGSQPLATAAYNAGPARSRRWRDGPPLEPAAWAENIPFSETRDYVKKVLSNATVYSALLTGSAQSLKARLGPAIAPRAETAPAPDASLP